MSPARSPFSRRAPVYARLLSASGALAFAAACSPESPTAPDPLATQATAATIAGSPALAAHAGTPAGTPNSAKYRDAGARPATGRSGSASLELRALYGADGSTEVEATTGSLEEGTRPGQISKVQVKLDGQGGRKATWNENTLQGAGYWSRILDDVVPMDRLQIQANVRGIDGRRTDVVTVSTQVYRRPDLSVQSVTAPGSAMPGAPVFISAVVAELNGDVGARGDCVLSVGSETVATAPGIWVDAGDMVSCSFTHVFDEPGTYDLDVSIVGVNPGDWRNDNNGASAVIVVSSPVVLVETGALRITAFNLSTGIQTKNYGPNAYQIDSIHNRFTTEILAQGLIYSYSPVPVERASVRVDVGGFPVAWWTQSVGNPIVEDIGDFRCWRFPNFALACGSPTFNGTGLSLFSYHQMGGTVTYVAVHSTCDPGDPGHCVATYYDNTTEHFDPGTLLLDHGYVVRVVVDFTNADGTVTRIETREATMVEYEVRDQGQYSYPEFGGTTVVTWAHRGQIALGSSDW